VLCTSASAAAEASRWLAQSLVTAMIHAAWHEKCTLMSTAWVLCNYSLTCCSAHLAHEGHDLVGARHVMHRVHGDDQVCGHIAHGGYQLMLLTCTVCCWQYRPFGVATCNHSRRTLLTVSGSVRQPLTLCRVQKGDVQVLEVGLLLPAVASH
jgi:hypothetical protein